MEIKTELKYLTEDNRLKDYGRRRGWSTPGKGRLGVGTNRMDDMCVLYFMLYSFFAYNFFKYTK
jgi:hypothetical protein